ncbi:hypothetical protein ABAC402_04575 [Asticcacaulis sp. AC402]|nr:hypothetical protein ABAC402_04575 [Asticcacaulis sp. AC402]
MERIQILILDFSRGLEVENFSGAGVEFVRDVVEVVQCQDAKGVLLSGRC